MVEMAKAIAFLVLLLISPAAYAATTHTVGGSSGWNTGVNYVNWASSQTFATGDTLVFNYDFTHAVDEVNEDDYNNCNTGNPSNSYSNSPTSVPLNSTGTKYFLCPRSNHCSQGMKLAVTVTGGSNTPGGSPPPSGTTPSTPETPPSTSRPPPPAGGTGGATTLGGRNSFIVGLSLVLAAMFGLMG